MINRKLFAVGTAGTARSAVTLHAAHAAKSAAATGVSVERGSI